ncbi:MAG: substrate-binding domain-containing protein [Candidatus Marinimicrobia bacterium]|nr:substrate-binding domain-containing protein [Candidatus Neomarinimicrobiota bacterium]
MKKISLLLLVLCVSFVFAGEKVISNGGSDNLSSADVKNIFLGKKKSWDNGSKIIICTLKSGATHENFITQVVKKQPGQFDMYWKQLVFTGRGTMPKSFSSEAEMITFITANKGAIGYVDEATEVSLTIISVQ